MDLKERNFNESDYELIDKSGFKNKPFSSEMEKDTGFLLDRLVDGSLDDYAVNTKIDNSKKRVVSNGYSSRKTEEFMNNYDGNGKFITWDLETVGTPTHQSTTRKGPRNHAITEIGFQPFEMKNGQMIEPQKAKALAVAPPKDIKEKYTNTIQELINNPGKSLDPEFLNEDMARSITDFALYKDKNSFARDVIGRHDVGIVTRQSAKRSSRNAMLNVSNLKDSLQGLNNLDEYGTNPETALKSFLNVSKGRTNVGHNHAAFDIPTMLGYSKDVAGDTKTGQRLVNRVEEQMNNSSVDTLMASRMFHQKSNPYEVGPNFTLSSMYNHVTGSPLLDAHFSGNDVEANTDVFKGLFKGNNKPLESNQEIGVGSRIVAKKGITPFKENSFTNNTGQYDTRYTTINGKRERTRFNREAPTKRGVEYEVMGMYENVPIAGKRGEDVAQDAMILKDRRNEEFSIVSSQDIGTYFNDEWFTKAGTPEARSIQNHARQDSARKSYERLVNPYEDTFHGSGLKQLESAYETHDQIKANLQEVETNHPDWTNRQKREEAYRQTTNKLNENKSDVKFFKGYNGIENIGEMGNVLEEERPFFEKVKTDARSFASGENIGKQTEIENAYLKEMYQEKERRLGSPFQKLDRPDGRSIQTKLYDETSNLDISNSDKLNQRMRSMLKGKSPSSQEREMHDFLRSIDNGIDGATPDFLQKNLMREVRNELESEDRLSTNLIQKISNTIIDHSESSGVVQAGIPVEKAGDVVDGVRRYRFVNGLKSGEDQQFKEMTEKASESVKNMVTQSSSVAGNAHDIASSLSNNSLFREHLNIGHAMEQHAMKTKDLNFDSMQKRYESGVENLLNSFNKYGYQTQLTYDKKRNIPMLFFGDENSRVGNMNSEQLFGSKSIGRMELPVWHSDYTVNVGNSKVTNRQKLHKRRDGSYGMTNTLDDTLSSLSNVPRNISQELEKQQATGKIGSKSDIYDSKVKGAYYKVKDSLTVSSYNNDSTKEGIKVRSVQDNIVQGTSLDYSVLSNDFLEEKGYGKVKELFDNYNNKNPYDRLDSFTQMPFSAIGNDKEAREQFKKARAHWKIDSPFYAQEKLEPMGLNVTNIGATQKQAANNIGVMMDAREMTPFGESAWPHQEAVIKSSHYRDINEEIARTALNKSNGPLSTDIRLGSSPRTVTQGTLMREKSMRDMTVIHGEMNDFEYHKRLTDAGNQLNKDSERLRKEIESLEQAHTSESPGSALFQKREELEEIERKLAVIDKNRDASTYDGTSMVRSSLAGSFEDNIEQRYKLKDGQIDDQLESYLRETDRLTDDFNPNKSYTFDQPLTSKELQIQGLLDDRKQLTIGGVKNLENDDYAEKIKTKMHTNQWSVTGYNGETGEFITSRRDSGTTGDKFFIGNNRQQGIYVDDEMFDIIGAGNFDVLGPNQKASKQTGLNNYLEKTNYLNVQLQQDIHDVSTGNKSLEDISPNLRQKIEEADLPLSELSKHENSNAIVGDILQPVVEDFDLQNDIRMAKDNYGLITSGKINSKKIQDASTAQAFGNRMSDLLEEYGIEDQLNPAAKQMSLHNVARYQGSEMTKVSWNDKDFQNLDVKEFLSSGPGQNYVQRIKDQAGDSPQSEVAQKLNEEIGHVRSTSKGKTNREIYEDALNRDNSVIFDMSGDSSAMDSNAYTRHRRQDGNNGAYLVNYSEPNKALPRQNAYGTSDMKGLDLVGTIAEPNTVSIKDNATDKIGKVGEIGEGKAQSYVKLPDIEGLNENFIPAYNYSSNRLNGMKREHREMYTGMQDEFSQIVRNADELSKLPQSEDKNIRVNRLNQLVEEYNNNSAKRWQTNKSNGGFNKMSNSVQNEHSGFFRSQAKNIGANYELAEDGNSVRALNNHVEDTIELNPEDLMKRLSGEEENLVNHFEMDRKDFTIGDTNKLDNQKVLDEISNKLSVDNEEASDFFQVLSRDPNNTENAKLIRNVRTNDRLDSGMIGIGAGTAKQASGDYDGDYFGLIINGLDASESDFKQEQFALRKQMQAETSQAINIGQEEIFDKLNPSYRRNGKDLTIKQAMNDYIESGQGEGKTANDLFKPKTGFDAEYLNQVSATQKESIGSLDNLGHRLATAGEEYSNALQNNGTWDAHQAANFNAQVDDVRYNWLSQNAIGVKHINTDTGATSAELKAQSIERSESINELSQAMNSLEYGNEKSTEDFKKIFQQAIGSDIEDEELNNIVDTVTPLSEFTKMNGNQDGLDSAALKMQSGGTLKEGYEQAGFQSTASKNLLTSQGKGEIVERSEEQMQNWAQKVHQKGKGSVHKTLEEVGEAATDNMSPKNFNTESFSDMGDALNNSSYLRESVEDFNKNSGTRMNSMKEGIGKTVKGALPAAGLFAGIWATSALFRKSPTPEGNEAQQEQSEASNVEVNPSALLSSPTARVRSNGEAINLNVQAEGNGVSEQDVAAMVNQQVSYMTGTSMEMNVNVQDNTAEFNDEYYDGIINKAMGFN